MSAAESQAVQSMTLGDLFAGLWRGKFWVASGVLVGCVLAALFCFTATPHYRAHMIISPANPMNGAEVSSLLAEDNLFALRYLVQRVGVANSSDFMRFENKYAEATVAGQLLEDPNIMRGLDFDRSFTFSKPQEDWSAEKLAAYIHDRVRLEPVGATPLRRMVYDHPNESFAVYFLQAVHAETDELIRENIRTDAEERVRYLQGAIKSTQNPEHRRALTTLLLEQERLRMLVSIEQPYAASIIEQAASSFKPVWPNAALVFPAFVFAFSLLGFAAFVFAVGAQGEMTAGGRRKIWFRTDSKNTNDPPLSVRDAAE